MTHKDRKQEELERLQEAVEEKAEEARAPSEEDSLATPELIARAEAEHRLLWVWTVNDPERISELLAAPGVTGVITDDPALACSLRDEVPPHPIKTAEVTV